MDFKRKNLLILLLIIAFLIPCVSAASSSCMGTISVRSNPAYAKVYLDGSYQGETSPKYLLQIKGVSCGTHTVEVKMNGYQTYSEEVTVEAASGYKVVVTLTPVTTATTVETPTEVPATEATTETTPGILSVTVISGILVSMFVVMRLRKE